MLFTVYLICFYLYFMSFLVLYLFFCCYSIFVFFFFFSSRRRHTRCLSAWSSDVCSSDLLSPSTTCGTVVVFTALVPVSTPAASNSLWAVRKRPRASNPSVAKPSGLIAEAWQLAQIVPGISVIASTLSRVVMFGPRSGGFAFAPGGGGGIVSHRMFWRTNTPFMIGRVFAVPVDRNNARVSRPGRWPADSTGGAPVPFQAATPYSFARRASRANDRSLLNSDAIADGVVQV